MDRQKPLFYVMMFLAEKLNMKGGYIFVFALDNHLLEGMAVLLLTRKDSVTWAILKSKRKF